MLAQAAQVSRREPMPLQVLSLEVLRARLGCHHCLCRRCYEQFSQRCLARARAVSSQTCEQGRWQGKAER